MTDASLPPQLPGAALLAATGMLAGCDTLDDIFASRKDIRPGERRSVLEMEKPVSVDEGLAARPVDLPRLLGIAALVAGVLLIRGRG